MSVVHLLVPFPFTKLQRWMKFVHAGNLVVYVLNVGGTNHL